MSAPDATPHLSVEVSRVVAGSPAAAYAVISDVTSIGERSPETVAARWIEPGETFRGTNRIGPARWSSVATITEAVPGRAFAFEISPPSRSRWRYDLEEVPGSTRVTESMVKDDPQPLFARVLQRALGVRDREAHLRAGMTTTLDNLDAALRAGAPA